MSFPKKGKFFPGDRQRRAAAGEGSPGPGANYARYVTAALRQSLGETHAAVKAAALWTGANERTVKNWLSGRYGPSGEHLIALARHSDEVLEVFLTLSGRRDLLAAMKIVEVRARLIEMLALLDQERGDHEIQR